MNLIEFLSGLGFGAIAAVLVQAWLSDKSSISKRNFQEKKEAYLGYLDALNKSEIDKTDKAALKVGHWENRIELVGSKTVIQACQGMRETNPINEKVHPDRPKALKG